MVRWKPRGPLPAQTALSARLHLCATADPPGGVFEYSPAAGFVPHGPGAAVTLSVTYRPPDPALFESLSLQRSLPLEPLSPLLDWPLPQDPLPYGTSLGPTILCARLSPGRNSPQTMQVT